MSTHSAEPPGHQTVVKDLAYGVSLYHVFQQQNLAAITNLMVGKSRNALQKQPDDADLLLASLYFDYGLPDQTADIFSRLLDANLAFETRQSVWFNLARVHYEQGRYELAADYLTQLTSPLPGVQENHRHYLQSSLHLERGEIALAIKSASAIPPQDNWRAYAEYNIGIAQLTAQDTEKGLKRLQSLTQMETPDVEIQALQDTARLVSGLVALKLGNFDAALLEFEKISIHSPVTSKALLATGTAWSRKQEPDRALSYWQLLVRRNEVDRASLEASLAIANVYEQQLNNKTLAARAFDEAVKRYDEQLTDVDELMRSIPQLQLYKLLSSQNLFSGSGSGLLKKDPLVLRALRSIQQTLSGKTLLQALQQYRELQEMVDTLETWKSSISAFQLMLRERRQSFAAKQPLVALTLDPAQLQLYQQQRDALAMEVLRIQTEQDFLALADADEVDYLEQLEEVKTLLSRIQQVRDVSAEQQKYRLLYGLLYWDISTDFAPRYWKLKHQLQLLDRALEQALASAASVQQISTRYNLKLDALNERIDKQNSEMQRLDSTLSELVMQQQEYINRLVVEALQQRKKQLGQLRLYARYSLARLYDELSSRAKRP